MGGYPKHEHSKAMKITDVVRFLCGSRRLPSPLRVSAVLAALGLAGSGAAASEEPQPAPPPPDFMSAKHAVPDQLIKEKREGRYWTAFPAIGWDPETLFTFGALAQIYDNGPANSPFFYYAPYRERIALGATASTGGRARGFVAYDLPYVAGSPWRVRAAVSYGVNTFENYFGIGESTLGPLTYPGSTREFSSMSDYTKALDQVVDGETWKHYNQYDRREGNGAVSLERDYLGGRLRPQLGLQFSYVKVHDYTGENIDGAIQQPTRLFSDYTSRSILGFDGGWDNALKLGLTYDTRDFEPDPMSGIMLQLAARLSLKALGSDFNYEQLTLSARGFHNLLRQPRQLVLAGRVAYVMQFGDVPFYSAPIIPLTDMDIQGLGGFNTLRGYVQNRFVGKAASWASAELRWGFAETTFLKQHLRFMLAPFVDVGSVFNSVSDTSFKRWKYDAGAGLRLAWNLSTIISFDLARSSESTMFYMEVGHQF